MAHSLLRTVFIGSLVLALLGGVLLIAWQALGLILGSGGIVGGPNGVFKTVLCIASSVSAVAAYLLLYAKPRVEQPNQETVR
ncbi:hypothetical protein [Nocardioides insulae]|uniref:hypothetical protein n=1 Tax=Nocardioides insulae TaxID=394734 RepID=UPI00041F4245|nr:hypothetical protein [Nocardioides insulae]